MDWGLMILTILFSYLNQSKTHQVRSNLDNATMQGVYELFKAGENYKEVARSDNVVVVLGLAGSGKTTLIHFITEKNLEAYEVPPNSKNYIIQDGNGKIRRGISLSDVFPERIVDNDVVYYDCPGFNDLRNPVDNIAASYYIKNILNRARRVKFIITATHGSLKPDGAEYFTKLLRYVSAIIKDVKKYENSILLVVTKVENNINRAKEKFNDQQITTQIADFIKHFQRITHPTKNIDSLLNTFTNVTNVTNIRYYRNIALFRKPETKGPLSSKLLKGERNRIKIKVENRLVYVTKSQEDFGYEISTESRMMIYNLYETFSNNITQDMRIFVDDLYNYLDRKNNGKRNFRITKKEMNSIDAHLSKFLENITLNISSFTEFVVKFINFMNSFDLDSSRQTFMNLFEKYKFIKFIEKISYERFPVDTVEWLAPFSRLATYLDQTNAWYKFLLNENLFYKLLVNYRISNCANINVTAIILETVSSNSQSDLVAIKEINENKINDLKNICEATLQDIKLNCKGSSLIVHSTFISINEITHKLNNVSICSNKLQYIKIYALDTLYIDGNIDLSERSISLIMAAPRWKVLKTSIINLNGKNINYPPEINPAQQKVNVTGNDGKGGLPGTSAGHFVGIGHAIQGKELEIYLNGGDGQQGQDGAKGGRGTKYNGENSIYYLYKYIEPILNQEYLLIKTFSIKKIGEIKKKLREVLHAEGKILFTFPAYDRAKTGSYYLDIELIFIIHCGIPGSIGATGGRAGAGGIGGFPGNATLLGFKNKAQFYITSISGANGASGAPGKGGDGGRGTDDKLFKLEVQDIHLAGMYPHKLNVFFTEIKSPCFNKTNYGRTGNHTEELVEPVGKPNKNKIDPFNEFLLFKEYILKSKNNIFDSYGLVNFFNYLFGNSEMNNKYDAVELFHEYESFEKKALHFTSDELIIYYTLFLERLEVYNFSRNPDNPNYTKLLLNFLYITVLCKISQVRHSTVNVIDLDTYSRKKVSLLEKFSNLHTEIDKMQYVSKYETIVMKKSKEIVLFTELYIFPELDELILNVNSELKKSINNTINIKHPDVSKESIMLKEKTEDEFKKLLEKKSILDGLKYCSVLMKILGPLFRLIVDHVKSENTVLNVLKLSNKENESHDKQNNDLVKLVKDGIQLFDRSARLKLVALKRAVEFMSRQMPSNTVLNNINKRMMNYSISTSTTTENREAEIFEKLVEELNSIEEFKSYKIGQMSNVWLNSTLQMQLAGAYTDIYLENIDSTDKFNKIIDALINTWFNDNLWLQISQLKLFTSTLSTLKFILKHLPVNQFNYEKIFRKGIVEHITSILVNYKEYSSKSSNIISVLIEKVNNAFMMVQHLQGIIWEYITEKYLSNYLRNIYSSEKDFGEVVDLRLKNYLNNLRDDTKRYLLLSKYNDAIYLFNRTVFPLADFYSKHIQIPYTRSSKSVSNIIKTKINSLKSKLNEYVAGTGLSTYIIDEPFNSSLPFYMWHQIDHEQVIAQYLSGKEIVLKASIEDSVHEKNAIKFKNIMLNIHITDETDNQTIITLKSKSKFLNVKMKHFGNSYFRCENKFYLLTTPTYEFDYNMEESEKNKGYDSQVPYLLSPFATWSFQLKNISDFNFEEFKGLLNGKVDLRLIGAGRYINNTNNPCSKVINGYPTVQTISVLDKFI